MNSRAPRRRSSARDPVVPGNKILACPSVPLGTQTRQSVKHGGRSGQAGDTIPRRSSCELSAERNVSSSGSDGASAQRWVSSPVHQVVNALAPITSAAVPPHRYPTSTASVISPSESAAARALAASPATPSG
jgi:hypothetical protein